jgi:transcriptional regulator with XRE-family HTH domain
MTAHPWGAINMATILPFQNHALTSSTRTGFKKASIGTAPPETSLNRTASLRDASLRPAKRLRKCAGEQSAASASCSIDIPAPVDQRSMGCGSDMAATISTRNGKSQPEIFLGEISVPSGKLLQCDMAKRSNTDAREIFLGDWLAHFEIGPTEAAKIAGCTQSYISNISRGARTNINALYLLKLSEHLEVNINDFFRPLPSQAQIAPLKGLSPKAQAAILAPKRRKA